MKHHKQSTCPPCAQASSSDKVSTKLTAWSAMGTIVHSCFLTRSSADTLLPPSLSGVHVLGGGASSTETSLNSIRLRTHTHVRSDLSCVRHIYVDLSTLQQKFTCRRSTRRRASTGIRAGKGGVQKTFENREEDPRSLAPCRRVVIEPPSLASGCAASLASIRELPAVKGRRRDRE